MVAWARTRLRATFLDAGIGITGANFLVAETGTAIVLENEGNGRLVSSLPRCHVVVVGIEKLVDRMADAAFLIEQLSLSAIARELPSYVSLIASPARDGDDGPDELVVVVVDAGRPGTRRHALRGRALVCIRCGSCLNACPVSRQGRRAGLRVGLLGADRGRAHAAPAPACARTRVVKLPSLSSLCGACTRGLPGGHPAARPAGARPGRCGAGRRDQQRRAHGLARLVTRVVEPAALPRLREGGVARPRRSRAVLPAGRRAEALAPLAARGRQAGRPTPAGPRSNGTSDDRRLSRRRLGLGSRSRGCVPTSGAARSTVAELLAGFQARTVCHWEGDALVASLDPVSLATRSRRCSPMPVSPGRSGASRQPAPCS